jgi:protein TonB
MLEQRLHSPVAPSDRLAATLCIAVILHAMIVLGITFTPEPTPKRAVEGLEITLVTQKSADSPEHAELLAQANSKGGGTDDNKGRSAAPLVAPMPSPTPALAAAMPRAEPPVTQQKLPLDPMTHMPAPAKQKVSEAAHTP